MSVILHLWLPSLSQATCSCSWGMWVTWSLVSCRMWLRMYPCMRCQGGEGVALSGRTVLLVANGRNFLAASPGFQHEKSNFRAQKTAFRGGSYRYGFPLWGPASNCLLAYLTYGNFRCCFAWQGRLTCLANVYMMPGRWFKCVLLSSAIWASFCIVREKACSVVLSFWPRLL